MISWWGPWADAATILIVGFGLVAIFCSSEPKR